MGQFFDQVAEEWDDCADKVKRANITARKIMAIPSLDNKNLIDFGSGTGLLGIQLCEIFQHVLLVDSSEKMLGQAELKIRNSQISNMTTKLATDLFAIDGQYSAIVTLMTLHHILDTRSFFESAYERLTVGGCLVIADLYSEDGSFHKHNPSFDGHNGFNVSDLTELAQYAGFTVESTEQYHEIWQENFSNEITAYPLFLFVARKTT
ncbi:class I SAM-dependent methyltransferase [Vibrio sp. SA48]|uniref:class I SAM-dependent DNA methyltransferase n=1 Tax=Vibrio sp. S12_S33 TaxID=2720223 RepID=UPI00178604F2|nr:class I SAM-dependent methyltransferase [Vibrio sp. S12_S33]MBD1567624.1 class I SAM-dependent methyltransferase [Vibrio sp. S12_S33]